MNLKRHSFQPDRPLSYWVWASGLAAVYVIAGRLSLHLASVNPSATAVWPPTGIALAAVLLIGYEIWPAIFLGAFITNVLTAGTTFTSFCIAAGNTLEGVVGAYLVQRFAGGLKAFDRAQDTFKYAALAAMVSTAISATIGTTTLLLGGLAHWARAGAIWLTWWLGDAGGALIVAPLIILMTTKPPQWKRVQLLEMILLVLSLLVVGRTVFGPLKHNSLDTYSYMCIPALLWAAFRFGPCETAIASFLMSALAITGTMHGHGPFAQHAHAESLAELQIFSCFLAVLSLAVAAVASEDKKVKEELKGAMKVSEGRYRQIVETAEEGIWMTDSQNKITFVNKKMAELLDYAPQEMLGKLLFGFMDIDEAGAALESEGLHPIGTREHRDYHFRRKDGSSLWTLVSISPLTDNEGHYVGALGMVTDISERKDLEQRYMHAQRLEGVGRLAGGVAHDFNNLMTAILGYCKLLEESFDVNDARLGDLLQIKDASQRAATLTQQLLAFSRKQVLKPTVMNLNTVVANMQAMLSRLIGERIALSVKLDPKLNNVEADAGQLEQVIMNLVVNARDAIEKNGRILIETMNVAFKEDSPSRHDIIPPGNYCLISVSDTGCGMDRKTLSHIFEPFFTTKERGKGTGLGLSTAYGIVKQSGGYVWVYSEVGRGSTFKIYFPISKKAVAKPADTKPSTELRGSETILLVEDDASVLNLLYRVLTKNGYKVFRASNGKEAIRLVEQKDQPLDLILTDMVMPELDGRGLAEYANAARPEIKFIFMSGYTDDFIAHRKDFDPGSIFVQKPVASDELLRKIRETLDKSKGGRHPRAGGGPS